MRVFSTERTARKPHKCSRCLGQIRPGERYRAYSIPPDTDLGGEKWVSGREHLSETCIIYADVPQPEEVPW